MHIIHIASELAPIAKVGGLADVVYGLCQATSKIGHTIEIILPKYDCIDYSKLTNLKIEKKDICIVNGADRYNNTIWSANLGVLKILLVESHHPQNFYNRGIIYGCPDDIDRFVYFSYVAMQYLLQSGRRPDILHVHDWHTSLVTFLCQKNAYKLAKSVITIHNLAHQGICSLKTLLKLGIDFIGDFSEPVNLLKIGILYSDRIAIVSPNYQKEIQTPEGGCGLNTVLQQSQKKLVGILNGIDQEYWDPEKDPYLKMNYSVQKLEKVLKAKQKNKFFLQEILSLTRSNTPLVASITRLVPQKAPDLIAYSINRTLELGGQFVLLGSTSMSSPHIKEQFETLQEKYRSNNQVAIVLTNDEALAHLIFAGADLFIIPSLFEPCGLTQMISMRYGTIPIARMTGGLVDTVFDVDTSDKPFLQRNGFTFEFPDQQGINWALGRALNYYKNPVKWQELLSHTLLCNFSWEKSSEHYLLIYKELLQI